jgi:hypothetical protein
MMILLIPIIYLKYGIWAISLPKRRLENENENENENDIVRRLCYRI